MGIKKYIKNKIGDLLGYPGCPVIRDTIFNEAILIVPYAIRGDSYHSIACLSKALREYTLEDIAQRVRSNAMLKDRITDGSLSLIQIIDFLENHIIIIPEKNFLLD